MFRLFSLFTATGRFTLLLVLNMIIAGGGSAQEMREHDHPGPTLVSPANGAVVDHQFTVRIGFAGANPHGPSEGTGIVMGPPPPPPDMMPPPPEERDDHGPAEGTGLTPPGGFRPRGPHFVLLVDSPALDRGTIFKPDAQHIAFPAGIPQMTVSLPPGQHRSLLQTLDRDGSIAIRRQPEPILVQVKG